MTEGHNSNAQLVSIAQRIRNLEEEKATISEDIKEVYTEAKYLGYNTKILRKALALLKRDANEVATEAAELEVYLERLKMLA